MSPEQVRGAPVDARSDIFSFGSMLFEMLTGQRAFRGDTPAETMTAILKEDPKELASLNETLPPALDHILRHCLEKDPALRVQSARDLAFELEPIGGLSSSRVQALSALPGIRRRHLLWAASGLLTGVAATGFSLWATGRLKPAGTRGPIHVSVTLPTTERLGGQAPRQAATVASPSRAHRARHRAGRTGRHHEGPVDPSSERILGASVVGAEAGELIHVFVVMMQAGATARALVDAECVHPTFAEGLQSLVMRLGRYALA